MRPRAWRTSRSAEATDPTTLVIHYDGPVGNALEQLETFFILPEHQWKPLVGRIGAGLQFAPQEHLDTFVTGGAYTIQSFEKKGKVVFRPNPNYYGTRPTSDAVVLQFYTNADAMIADLEQGTPAVGRPGAVRGDQRRQGRRTCS